MLPIGVLDIEILTIPASTSVRRKRVHTTASGLYPRSGICQWMCWPLGVQLTVGEHSWNHQDAAVIVSTASEFSKGWHSSENSRSASPTCHSEERSDEESKTYVFSKYGTP